MSFSALGLSSQLLRAIDVLGYKTPTPVQAAVIVPALRGTDVRALAQTGSGKTAAFALPILQRLQLSTEDGSVPSAALILVPTRELAAQVAEAFRNYGRFLPQHARIVTVHGGVSINPQLLALHGGADIVVATPGRLLDLVERNALSLSTVTTLVLDEADRLLDLGFIAELGKIISLLPKTRQCMLFSATFPKEVTALVDELLQDFVRVELAQTLATKPDIEERAIEVDSPQRTQLLRYLIQHHAWAQVLVFVATKYSTEHVAVKLRRADIRAGAINGELSQGARTQALADFKAGKLQVLVATDLAARGLDIVELDAVVNYDLPRSTVDYTHRIGRTGRAGKSGVAVSFISAESHAHFQQIEKRQERALLMREQIEGFEPTEIEVPVSPPTGGIKGKRKSKKDKLRDAAAGNVSPEPIVRASASNSIRWHRLPTNHRRS